jgi:hypothetical protein
MPPYCTNCGGDGFTADAPKCPACNGTGRGGPAIPRHRRPARERGCVYLSHDAACRCAAGGPVVRARKE